MSTQSTSYYKPHLSNNAFFFCTYEPILTFAHSKKLGFGIFAKDILTCRPEYLGNPLYLLSHSQPTAL